LATAASQVISLPGMSPKIVA